MNVIAEPKFVRIGYVVELTFKDPRTQQVHRTEETSTILRTRQDALIEAEKLAAKFLSDSIMSLNTPKKARRVGERRQRARNTTVRTLADYGLTWADLAR